MSAIDKLRRVVLFEVPAYAFTVKECAELLDEIGRTRAETREACARVCDGREKIAEKERKDALGLLVLGEARARMFERFEARSDEAEACAAAIREMEKP